MKGFLEENLFMEAFFYLFEFVSEGGKNLFYLPIDERKSIKSITDLKLPIMLPIKIRLLDLYVLPFVINRRNM